MSGVLRRSLRVVSDVIISLETDIHNIQRHVAVRGSKIVPETGSVPNTISHGQTLCIRLLDNRITPAVCVH